MDRVMITIPTADQNHMNGFSVSAAHYAFTEGGVELNMQIHCTSLLARNFNACFAAAWAEGARYLLMIHSDVVPRTQNFGGIMLRHLKERGLAAISQVLPIKNADGYVSAGMDVHPYNYAELQKARYGIQPAKYRRLTTDEISNLPGVFCKKDICELWGKEMSETGAPIINTGLMLLDIDRLVDKKFPGFQINDYIAWNKLGEPFIFCEPEDWRFSRWMASVNLPYANMHLLNVEHMGGGAWSTQHKWGKKYDDTATAVGLCPEVEEFEQMTESLEQLDAVYEGIASND